MNRYGLAGLMVCVALAGCGPVTVGGGSVTRATGPGLGMMSWVELHDEDPTSPFHAGCVAYAEYEFVLWCGWDPRGETRVHGGESCTVTTFFDDGKPLAAECASPHKRSGPVTIGDQKFELADGNLFLVTGPSDRPRVKQLKRDLSGVNFKDRKSLQAFGAGTPEINTFFSEK